MWNMIAGDYDCWECAVTPEMVSVIELLYSGIILKGCVCPEEVGHS